MTLTFCEKRESWMSPGVISGSEGGIRTPGIRKGSTVFETAQFNRSRTSPGQISG